MIFVFGSNEAGLHGAGAARVALREHGAVPGRGHGRHGNSYAIPTKDGRMQTLKLGDIEVYVRVFLEYARAHPEEEFQITQIGCGLAGYLPWHIAPMFEDAPDNCLFDTEWEQSLPNRRYWGHV